MGALKSILQLIFKEYKDMKTKEESKIYQKRLILSSLSRKAKKIQKAKIERAKTDNEKLYWASKTINQMLMITVYNPKGKLEYKKFNDWKAEGKTVKKGEKAIFVWGQPTGIQKQKEALQKGENFDAENEELGKFPICFLFSNLQVM